MAPATDRMTKTAPRWIWSGLGLALALGQAGCAELKSQVFGTQRPPAEIGQRTDVHEMAAQAGRATPADQPSLVLASGPEPSTPSLARVPIREVGAAILPAPPPQDPSVGGVSLQPPLAIEPRPDARPAPPGRGLPDASRIIALAEPRASVGSTTDPSRLVAEARAALAALTTYQVAMHRQERVNGTLLPEEDIVLAVRREPKAVRLTWADGPNQGREVIYRADEPGGSMHVKLANPAMPRLTLAPESPMVMRNSRHPVTEAGLDSLVEGLERVLRSPEASGIRYEGLGASEGFDHAIHRLVRVTPSGETWRVDFDPRTHLPALVHAVDARGDLLESYTFRDVRPNPPELASAGAFDADARWGPPRGLFGRFARGDDPTVGTTPP